ncbi:hypothetical protein R3P38DRAFT_2674640 [Favolaschia claudopus]|uniref:Uncharacterized protein n=1 Tax=Favolaschia claudopus TaxID=2862362 RepID=A0AAW0EFE4_9AGAR
MSLSSLETISIVRSIAPDAVLLDTLPGYLKPSEHDEAKIFHKQWLDNLASLLKCSSGVFSKQVCAVSISLLQSGCTVTVAFNSRPESPEYVVELIHSVRKWMKEAHHVPLEQISKKNHELLKIILGVSLSKLRRWVKEKGWFMDALVTEALKGDLSGPQKQFILAAKCMHIDLMRRISVEDPDLERLAKVFPYHIESCEAEQSKLDGVLWLHEYERLLVKPAGVRWPSLRRYLEKFRKPYNQYILIREGARKSYIRAALSLPLAVNILPNPTTPSIPAFPSMLNFEPRIRSFLRHALHSYSPAAVGSPFADRAIDDIWQRIQKVDQSASLQSVHSECALLHHHLNLGSHDRPAPTPYPYFGASKPSCFQCGLYFQAYRATTPSGPMFQMRTGSPGLLRTCTLPMSTRGPDEVDEVIWKEMGAQASKVVGFLVNKRINLLEEQSRIPRGPAYKIDDEFWARMRAAGIQIQGCNV